MQTKTIARLIDLNRQFYQTFALQFSATRRRLQPGVQRVIESLPPAANLLDLGCGNGELACELLRRDYSGGYMGLDFSQELLQQARTILGEQEHHGYEFQQADLTMPDWEQILQGYHPQIILAFAVLHHIPGAGRRRELICTVRRLLPSDGQFIFSVWQFLSSPRLMKRIQPWEVVGLNASEVDEGDYLLDWRHGGHGLRYVHHFNQAELLALADETGFELSQAFMADGENGKLGLYQVWTLC
ncbi:MAG: methyltransferase domain-containing protein [Anaerolineales bacterium]|nr:methyltransferase domain-containing protein [Anaerolineales bacterium]